MMYRNKILRVMLLVVSVILLSGAICFAGVPQMINYSGTLTNSSGTPVPNGNYNIEFKIYDVASGGASLWSEKWDSTTSQVPVVGGTFNVMLGFQSPIPATFFAEHPVAYLGIKVGTDSEMLPRQQITSVGYAFTAGNGVPKGGVIMWSGAVDQIPAGWALCDGNNGTPNLMDRFVVGAGSGYAVAATGGSATVNLQHSHTVNDHNHLVSGSTGGPSGTSDAQKGSGTPKPESNHTHNVSIWTGGASNRGTDNSTLSSAQNILPPYYALAYIMKL